MAKTDYFCERPIILWLIAMMVCAVAIVGSIVIDHEDNRFVGEGENIRAKTATLTVQNPVEPQRFAPNSTLPSKNNPVDGITKATPYGGFQFAAQRFHSAFQNALKDAVDSVLPCVCDIHATWMNRSGNLRWQREAQDLQFLAPFNGTIDKFIQNRGYENIGAGILVDSQGYVLTNFHVVQDASNIKVTVLGNPGRDYDGEIAAHDVRKDLALLKLAAEGVSFPEAPLGDSSFTEIGDVVIAMGSPFGMEQTVTSGIVSGIRKTVRIEGIRYDNLFQTDAPINRGSSGGPLVNLEGEVIGINTGIYAPTGAWSGTGFAIPINDAKQFLASALGRTYPIALDKRGMFAEPVQPNQVAFAGPLPVRFGMEVMTLSPVAAAQFGVKGQHGVLVNRVFPDCPASISGIRRGDIITSIAGVQVQGIEAIPGIVSHFKAGDSVNMRIIRNGRTDEMLVRLW